MDRHQIDSKYNWESISIINGGSSLSPFGRYIRSPKLKIPGNTDERREYCTQIFDIDILYQLFIEESKGEVRCGAVQSE